MSAPSSAVGAPFRVVRSALRTPEAWSRYVLAGGGAADFSSVERRSLPVRIALWRIVRRIARSPAAREYATCVLTHLDHPPPDLVDYISQHVSSGRLSSAATLVSQCESRLPDDVVTSTLDAIHRRLPSDARTEVAAVLLCGGRRSLRMQRLLDASGIWDWRRLIPRDIGAVPLTLSLPQDTELSCERCGRRRSLGPIIVGPARTICAACLASMSIAETEGGASCLVCGTPGRPQCAICEEQVRALTFSAHQK